MRVPILPAVLLCALTALAAVPSRTVVDLDAGWRFHLGDDPGSAHPAFDDSAWARVDVPHDWSAAGPFSADLGSGNGFAPGGVGWYRRRFRTPDQGWSRCEAAFDGVYDHAEVWVNGHFAGGRPGGYTPFRVDLGRWLKRGSDNVLAVRVDHGRQADSRWYTGSGIYRHVDLVFTGELRLDAWDTAVRAIPGAPATVSLLTQVHGPAGTPFTLEAEVLAPEGHSVARASIQGRVQEGALTRIEALRVPDPRLWSPETPHLYTLQVSLRGAEGTDALRIPFGIREARFDAARGFLLNGVPLKLKGVCLHHDAGCLGAAVPGRVWERRLAILRSLGVNAIRTSHNPPSAEFLDLADRMGFLVKEEAFDEFTPGKNKWVKGKNDGVPSRQGYAESFAEWSVRDVEAMVRRDRNHPCVVLWSIGNEIDYPNDPFTHPVLGKGFHPGQPRAEEMVACARPLVAAIKALDPTRPVTAALASVAMSEAAGFADLLDAVGYNYQEARYEEDHRRHPGRIIYGSETSHAWKAWRAVTDHDFIAGQFLWTGIDYLGEAGEWPSRGSASGLLDLCGFVKPLGWFRRCLWDPAPRVHASASCGAELQDSWNWPAASRVKVLTFTNCPQVRLTLNGRILGTRDAADAHDGMVAWDVPFEAGILRAEGLRNGRVEDRQELVTSGAPASVALLPELGGLRGDGRDVLQVVVEIRDALGRRVPTAGNEVRFEVEGPARILGLGNGDLRDAGDPRGPARRAFEGRGLVILGSTGGAGTVRLRATAPGLSGAELRVEVQDAVR